MYCFFFFFFFFYIFKNNVLNIFCFRSFLAQLLKAVYDDLVPNPKVVDITVEDPSDEFRALRDFVDCQNALKLSSFRPPKIHRPYMEAAEAECRTKLKLQRVRFMSYVL